MGYNAGIGWVSSVTDAGLNGMLTESQAYIYFYSLFAGNTVMTRLSILALLLSAMTVATTNGADAVGTWRWEHEDLQGRGTVKDVLVIKEADGKLSAVYTGADGDVDIESIKVEGDQLTWSFDVDAQGQQLTVTFSGKVEGNKVEGEVSLGDFGEFPWAAERDSATDPTGTWRWEHEDLQGRGTVKDVLVVSEKDGKLAAVYTGADGDEKINAIEVDGDKLTWSFEVDAQGQKLTVTFSGKIIGDDVEGEVSLGDFGEFPWAAKRDPKKEEPAGEPMNWNITVNMPDGSEAEAVLTIMQTDTGFGSKANYNLDGQDLPIEDFQVDEEGAFSFTLNVEDFGLVAKFKGQSDGVSAEGTIEYDLNGDTGETDFTGELAD